MLLGSHQVSVDNHQGAVVGSRQVVAGNLHLVVGSPQVEGSHLAAVVGIHQLGVADLAVGVAGTPVDTMVGLDRMLVVSLPFCSFLSLQLFILLVMLFTLENEIRNQIKQQVPRRSQVQKKIKTEFLPQEVSPDRKKVIFGNQKEKFTQ